jgi:hypothetical protein
MSELLEAGIEFATAYGLQIVAMAVAAFLALQVMGRIYQRCHDAGRERMGLREYGDSIPIPGQWDWICHPSNSYFANSA